MDRSVPVATRCSMYFCEAYAMSDTLHDNTQFINLIKKELKKENDREFTLNEWKITRISIVSDSLTAISGSAVSIKLVL